MITFRSAILNNNEIIKKKTKMQLFPCKYYLKKSIGPHGISGGLILLLAMFYVFFFLFTFSQFVSLLFVQLIT